MLEKALNSGHTLHHDQTFGEKLMQHWMEINLLTLFLSFDYNFFLYGQAIELCCLISSLHPVIFSEGV